MQKEQQEAAVPSPEELKALGAAEGPCITILIGVHRTEQRNRHELVRLRNAIQTVTAELTAKAVSAGTIRDLLGPIEEFLEEEMWPKDCGAFAILRSPNVFRTFGLREEVRDAAIVDEHFYILPLLRALENRRSFYVLALSQRHPRLLYCTENHSEEVPLPAGIPRSVDEWLSTGTPEASKDHKVQRGGEFTSPTDRDNFSEHLLNYFRVLDRGIADLVKGTSKPLVLAGVEKDLSLFRSVNSYAHLAARDVHGAPDGLKGGEMHKRALEVVQPEFESALEKALADFERLGGTNRTATDGATIAKAAREGRIAQLLIGDTPLERQDHLINTAAVETIAHAGAVMVVEPERVPAETRLAAILRY